MFDISNILLVYPKTEMPPITDTPPPIRIMTNTALVGFMPSLFVKQESLRTLVSGIISATSGKHVQRRPQCQLLFVYYVLQIRHIP